MNLTIHITDACIERLKKNGTETVTLPSGDAIELRHMPVEPPTNQPGLTGDGFYVEAQP